MCEAGAVGTDSQPPSVDSNTLYSAQECLNRRALGRVPYTENSASSPAVNRTKIITSCKPWGPQGRGSAQGLGQVTLASTWGGWGSRGGWPTPRASRAWEG